MDGKKQRAKPLIDKGLALCRFYSFMHDFIQTSLARVYRDSARACMITGQISDSNVELANGEIVLSTAAILLLQEGVQTAKRKYCTIRLKPLI